MFPIRLYAEIVLGQLPIPPTDLLISTFSHGGSCLHSAASDIESDRDEGFVPSAPLPPSGMPLDRGELLTPLSQLANSGYVGYPARLARAVGNLYSPRSGLLRHFALATSQNIPVKRLLSSFGTLARKLLDRTHVQSKR